MNALDRLPPCGCGARAWQDWGLSLSVLMMERGRKCHRCRRVAREFGIAGVFTFIVPAGEVFTDAHVEWVNAVCIPQWKARGKALDAAREALWPAAGARIARSLGLPDTALQYDDIPEAAREAWRAAYDAWADSDEYRRPPGCERAPVPPTVPAGLTVYVKQREGWQRVEVTP